jgi:hypothetical protein
VESTQNRIRHRRSALTFLAAALCLSFARSQVRADALAWPKAIRNAELSTTQPFFLPLHPRVTTTIRLPTPLTQEPAGDGFWVERDGASVPPSNVEYVLAWERGDTRMDIKALPNASLRNLNLSLDSRTYVLVCFPVNAPLDVSAAINFKFSETSGLVTDGKTENDPAADQFSAGSTVERFTDEPLSSYENAGPARWIGFMDRLHLLHAAPAGNLESLVRSMPKVSVYSPYSERDHGLFTSTLLRVARDDRFDLVGFIFLLKNTSARRITFDVTSCAARAGAMFFPQLTAELTPSLEPGGVAPGYFIIEGGGKKNAPLKAHNDWRLSFALLDPTHASAPPSENAEKP